MTLSINKLCLCDKMVPAHIKHSVDSIVEGLYESQFAQQNVDLQVDVIGALNYTVGMKLRLSFIDSFHGDDIDEWRDIARVHGATGIRTRVNASSGTVDLNIEYKRSSSKGVPKIWLLRSALLLVASLSYHQLHLLQSERYPLPSEWFV